MSRRLAATKAATDARHPTTYALAKGFGTGKQVLVFGWPTILYHYLLPPTESALLLCGFATGACCVHCYPVRLPTRQVASIARKRGLPTAPSSLLELCAEAAAISPCNACVEQSTVPHRPCAFRPGKCQTDARYVVAVWGGVPWSLQVVVWPGAHKEVGRVARGGFPLAATVGTVDARCMRSDLGADLPITGGRRMHLRPCMDMTGLSRVKRAKAFAPLCLPSGFLSGCLSLRRWSQRRLHCCLLPVLLLSPPLGS